MKWWGYQTPLSCTRRAVKIGSLLAPIKISSHAFVERYCGLQTAQTMDVVEMVLAARYKEIVSLIKRPRRNGHWLDRKDANLIRARKLEVVDAVRSWNAPKLSNRPCG